MEITTAASLGGELVRQFKDKSLEEPIGAKIISNEYGNCYLITHDSISKFRKADFDNLAGFCKNEDMAIIDIETLGISFECPIILLGIANFMRNKVCIRQFLLRDFPDELSAIWSFLSCINDNSSLISYNGRKFDIPYIKQRLSYYGKEFSLNNHHFDVLHYVYRAFGGKLPNYRLVTVERYFGIQRGLDISGWVVPHFYKTHLKTRNIGPIIAILKHNKQDIINLGLIVSRLYDLQKRKSKKDVKSAQRTYAYCYTHLRPPKPLSVNYPQRYFLNFLNLESEGSISCVSARDKVKGAQHWWEKRANKPYKCSACSGIIDPGERYIGRKKLIPRMRGRYRHKGVYITDLYHVFCFLVKLRESMEREIEKTKAKMNSLEREIVSMKMQISETKKRIEVCIDEKYKAKKIYETSRWWRKLDRWLDFQFKSLAKDRELSHLNREIVILENQKIPERRARIGNLQTQIKELTTILKEIENKIQELINADITRG